MANLSCKAFLSLYQFVFRSVIEYCSPTYHAMLNQDQSERLEKLPTKALKVIYGWNRSSASLMSLSGLESLLERSLKTLPENVLVMPSLPSGLNHPERLVIRQEM